MYRNGRGTGDTAVSFRLRSGDRKLARLSNYGGDAAISRKEKRSSPLEMLLTNGSERLRIPQEGRKNQGGLYPGLPRSLPRPVSRRGNRVDTSVCQKQCNPFKARKSDHPAANLTRSTSACYSNSKRAIACPPSLEPDVAPLGWGGGSLAQLFCTPNEQLSVLPFTCTKVPRQRDASHAGAPELAQPVLPPQNYGQQVKSRDFSRRISSAIAPDMHGSLKAARVCGATAAPALSQDWFDDCRDEAQGKFPSCAANLRAASDDNCNSSRPPKDVCKSHRESRTVKSPQSFARALPFVAHPTICPGSTASTADKLLRNEAAPLVGQALDRRDVRSQQGAYDGPSYSVPPPPDTSTAKKELQGLRLQPGVRQQFHKTKLCPYLEHCTNGVRCSFAHSLEEMRPLPDLTKTKLCEHAKRYEECPRAGDCKYAHSERELRDSPKLPTFKTSYCYFYKKRKCMNGNKCRFAHGPQELRSRAENISLVSKNQLNVNSKEGRALQPETPQRREGEYVSELRCRRSGTSTQSTNAEDFLSSKLLSPPTSSSRGPTRASPPLSTRQDNSRRTSLPAFPLVVHQSQDSIHVDGNAPGRRTSSAVTCEPPLVQSAAENVAENSSNSDVAAELDQVLRAIGFPVASVDPATSSADQQDYSVILKALEGSKSTDLLTAIEATLEHQTAIQLGAHIAAELSNILALGPTCIGNSAFLSSESSPPLVVSSHLNETAAATAVAGRNSCLGSSAILPGTDACILSSQRCNNAKSSTSLLQPRSSSAEFGDYAGWPTSNCMKGMSSPTATQRRLRTPVSEEQSLPQLEERAVPLNSWAPSASAVRLEPVDLLLRQLGESGCVSHQHLPDRSSEGLGALGRPFCLDRDQLIAELLGRLTDK